MNKSRQNYYPAIDGLRALAVVFVIIFHLDFLKLLPGGFTGVDVFFVISGYVISQALHQREKWGVVEYLKDFYRRRFLRVVPALLLVVSVSFIVSAMFVPQAWLSEQHSISGLAALFGISNIFLARNVESYFSPSAELNPYLHTWSLGVEEQFYLIFPIVYWVWLRYRHRFATAWALLPLLAAVSLTTAVYQSRTDPQAAFYLLPGRFWELAAGAILFQVIGTGRQSSLPAMYAHALLGAGLVLVIGVGVLGERDVFAIPWVLATVVGAMLVITAIVLKPVASNSPLYSLLQCGAATYIGRLSYSLYLWHWPVAVFLRWTTGMEILAVQLSYPIVVFALAAASYHWVEKPIRGGRSVFQSSAWLTIFSGLAAVGLSALGAIWVMNNSERLSLSQTRDSYTWRAYKHAPLEPVDQIDAPQLQGRQLFVVGDSHTAAYRTMLNIVSIKLGVVVREYEEGGCAVVSLMAADPASCADKKEAVLKDIESAAKPGDMVFLASLRMPELAGLNWQNEHALVIDEASAALDPENINDARRSAQAVLARLQALQLRVIIDAPKPIFKTSAYRCSDWFNRMNPICAPGLTIDRPQIERLRTEQMKLLDSLERVYPRLYVWDPLPILCPGLICSAYDDGGLPLYFDSNHLSGHGNRVLTESFINVLLLMAGGEDKYVPVSRH